MNISNIKNDLNVFKDETLRALRAIENKLMEKLQIKSIETETKIADFDNKLLKFQEINKRMYDSVIEQRLYLEKINYLNDFKSKTETRLISFDIKLSNYLSDLTSIKHRYDKIFLEQLTVPGIIGPSCKFKTISDYINESINNANLLKNEKELIKKQIDELKSKNEIFEKNLIILNENSISTCKLYTDTKINEIKNFVIKKLEDFDDLLVNTKFKIEQNVLKSEEITSSIQNEIKISKDEMTYLIKENQKDYEIIKNEMKKIHNNEMKKEINEIKKNITELKKNMEKQIVNAYKIGKNKNKNNIDNYDSNSLSNKNIFLKTNNLFNNEIKTKNSFADNEVSKKNVKYSEKNLTTTHKQFYSKHNSNNNVIKSINTITTMLKTQNDINKEINDIIEKENNNIINDKENNNITDKEKYHIKVGGKSNKFKNKENFNLNNNHLKEKKNENKTDYFQINPISILNNNKEHKVIMPQKLSQKNIINSNNILKINEQKSRNKILSKVEINNLIIEEKNLSNEIISQNKNIINNYNYKNKNTINNNQDDNKDNNMEPNIDSNRNNIIDNNFNSINNNNNNPNNGNNNQEEKITKFDSENNRKRIKYVIHSIDGENSLRKWKKKISKYNFFNNNKEKKNIAIKLMKNKMENVNNNNNDYLKQRLPTLGLYREYYNRKMKEQKEKENKDNIKVPKRVSPAFGRTAYIDFIKEDNNYINLKNYNGNMNIIINDNMDDTIEKSKYFNTINGELNPFFYKNKNKFKKMKGVEDDTVNLSV